MTTTRSDATAKVVIDRLRTWATGSHPLSAAIELLIRAFDGRFARPERPWVIVEPTGYVWLDEEVLHANLGPLSGGERRVLEVVCALADPAGTRRIHLADTLAGLDRTHLDLVLAACAHAAGSHEHTELDVNARTGAVQFLALPSAHPWPPQASPANGHGDHGATSPAPPPTRDL